jgi:TolB-like protein/Flp pilus assembly protein TadD
MRIRGAEMLRLTIFGRFRAADALGNEIPIKSKKARALLTLLALPLGKERSREEVMALLWSERGDEQARSSLRQALSGLRKELGDIADGALKVTDEWLALDPGLVAVEPASPDDVLLSGLHISDPAFDEWLRDERLRYEDAPAADARPPQLPLPDKPSIAVLPFTNLSADPEQEYFSDGITEDIITELSRFRSLFVIARNSSFHYKGQSPKVQDVGRDLGVQYVVQGSVRKAGSRLRISAQLVEAETGNHLWAERYDRELEDVFAVQDEVVQAIVAAIPGRIDEAAVRRARYKPTENLTAYDCLLRGEWYTRSDFAHRDAIAMFAKAIEIDPQCARAHVRLASYHGASIFNHGAPAEEAERKARSHAEQALAIDDGDSLAQSIAAVVYLICGEHDLARRHIERAIALNPNDPYVALRAGVVEPYLGNHADALRWMRTGMRLDPHFPDPHRENLFDAFYMARDYEQAVRVAREWPNPPHHIYAVLAAVYAQLGRMDEARDAVAMYQRERPKNSEFASLLAAHLKMCARQEDADHWLEGYRKAGFDV